MATKKVYTDLITKFLNKYETILSKKMIENMSNVYEWISGYDDAMSSAAQQHRITYMKRGANLMKRFVEQYETDASDIAAKLLQCRQALLGVGGVKLPSWCTEDTKDKLLKLAIDLRIFTKEFIGCSDAANKFFLDKLSKSANLLGEDYVKIKNSMEATCIHLRIEELKSR